MSPGCVWRRGRFGGPGLGLLGAGSGEGRPLGGGGSGPRYFRSPEEPGHACSFWPPMSGVLIQYTALSAWLPTFYSEVRGMSLARASFLTALLPLVGVFAVMAGALLPLRFGAPRVFLIVPGVMIIVGGLGSFSLGSTPAIYASVILVGIGSWLYVPTLLSWTMQLAGMVPENVAIVWGTLITVSGIGMFLSPILVGLLRDTSGTFTLGFFICSATAWSLLLAGILIPGGVSLPQSQDRGQVPT